MTTNTRGRDPIRENEPTADDGMSELTEQDLDSVTGGCAAAAGRHAPLDTLERDFRSRDSRRPTPERAFRSPIRERDFLNRTRAAFPRPMRRSAEDPKGEPDDCWRRAASQGAAQRCASATPGSALTLTSSVTGALPSFVHMKE